jgi:hypothetical protein
MSETREDRRQCQPSPQGALLVSVLGTRVTKQIGEMVYTVAETVDFPSFGLTHEDAFMPWKETRTVDQRLQFLSSYQREEMSVNDLCHEYGISRPIAYERINRLN